MKITWKDTTNGGSKAYVNGVHVMTITKAWAGGDWYGYGKPSDSRPRWRIWAKSPVRLKREEVHRKDLASCKKLSERLFRQYVDEATSFLESLVW